MSSALYDAALCSVDFAQLLPGLFNRDDNQHRTPSPPRRAKDATPHRAPKTTPHDHTATATRSEDTGAGLMARKHAHTNKGKHHGKKVRSLLRDPHREAARLFPVARTLQVGVRAGS